MGNATASNRQVAMWGQIGGWTTPEGAALWLLVALEVLVQVGLRRYFRKHHGG